MRSTDSTNLWAVLFSILSNLLNHWYQYCKPLIVNVIGPLADRASPYRCARCGSQERTLMLCGGHYDSQ
jgi:hypothetical protein